VSILFTDDPKVRETHWFSSNQILYLRRANNGNVTQFWIGNAVGERGAYVVGKVECSASMAKHVELADGDVGLVFAAAASPDGSLFNASKVPKSHTTAREYESPYVRCPDHYYTPERNALWYTRLECGQDGKYSLDPKSLRNALIGSGLECPASWGPSPASFSISKYGILFVCLGPDIAKEFRTSLYYLALSAFTEDPRSKPLSMITVKGVKGNANGPVYSLDGNSFAFTLARKYEVAGEDSSVFVGDSKSLKVREIVLWGDEIPHTQTLPSLIWTNDVKILYLNAEHLGRTRLFRVEVDSGATSIVAKMAYEHSSVDYAAMSSIRTAERRLLVTSTSIVDSNILEIVDTAARTTHVIPTNPRITTRFGLSRSQISNISFPGAGNYDVQAWLMKPSTLIPTRNIPLPSSSTAVRKSPPLQSGRGSSALLCLLNRAILTSNPTSPAPPASAMICADIVGDWGGRPYCDIEKCMAYLGSLPYVDSSRAFAMGGSYGGYMMNWIAGRPLARSFRTLVCVDGVFSTSNMIASDMVARKPLNYARPPLWEDPVQGDEFDPSRYTNNWHTPMLFVHSDLDYRVPVSQGWAAYAACQARGVESRFLNFPDEGHGVMGRENQLKVVRTVVGWVNKYVGVEGMGEVRLEKPVSEPNGERTRVVRECAS